VEAFAVRADKRRRLLDAALAELIALCSAKGKRLLSTVLTAAGRVVASDQASI